MAWLKVTINLWYTLRRTFHIHIMLASLCEPNEFMFYLLRSLHQTLGFSASVNVYECETDMNMNILSVEKDSLSFYHSNVEEFVFYNT